MLNHFYPWGMRLLAPVLQGVIWWRGMKGKEDQARRQERYGKASRPRPSGKPLIWIHASSVGEAQSVMCLIDKLKQIYPQTVLLVTTHTVTAAQLIQKRLGDSVIHQYFPYDVPQWGRRFLDFWLPTQVIWVESELWPGILAQLQARDIPVTLVNGRLSERSTQRWCWAVSLLRPVWPAFQGIFVQSTQDAQHFQNLGASNVTITGNLKFLAPFLPGDPSELHRFKTLLKNRPLWVAASTHAGEEELIGHACQQLKQSLPEILCILVPRHSGRASSIRKQLEKQGLTVAQRSYREDPTSLTDVYLVDTLGELGLFYQLAEVAFLGGSLVPVGGHNLIEAAQLECALIHGPYMHKQQDIAQMFKSVQATDEVTTAFELAQAVQILLTSPQYRHTKIKAAKTLALQQNQAGQHFLEDLCQQIRIL